MDTEPATLPSTMPRRLTGATSTPWRKPASRSSMMVMQEKTLANSIIMTMTPG